MGLNLKNLTKKNENNQIDPIKIFDILPKKNEKYSGYLRDIQTDVLESWMNSCRDKKNTILKMNTGSGKTVVGLLILKSYLNENKGPAAYFVPDNYLVKQVESEARDLNIEVTLDPHDLNFLRGKSILVTNIQKLVNGKSVFGIEEKKINLKAMIIDDAHGCVEICKNQVSFLIPRADDSFADEFFNRVRPTLVSQSSSKVLAYEANDNVTIPIPFWAFQDNVEYLQQAIINYADHSGNKYQRSLAFNNCFLLDRLNLADGFFTNQGLTITLRYAPVEQIFSFNECKHRIFMSATIEDESSLVTQFNLGDDYSIISPKRANDIGERLILMPQSLNPNITDEEMKKYIYEKGKKYNVVVLVPNYKKAQSWNGYHNYIQNNEDDVSEIVEKLKKQHIGVVVLVSRYDGIDLPKKSCEILVIDGIPDPKTPLEKYDQKILRGTKQVEQKMIRIVEQGMGRGIRSKEDYCVVFLMGKDLVRSLYVNDSINYFSPATLKQVELSEEVLDDKYKKSPIEQYDEALNVVLERNEEWIAASKEYLSEIEYNNDKNVDNFERNVKLLYNTALSMSDSQPLLDSLNKISKEFSDLPYEKAYLQYFIAKFINKYDRVKSQEIIKGANSLNNQIIRPIDGINYERKDITTTNQIQNIHNYIFDKYKSGNKLLVSINAVLDKLSFNSTSAEFENAIFELGALLGYNSQRPENDYGQGPDNLWGMNGEINFVIECKNERQHPEIIKSDCSQLVSSVTWFQVIYPGLKYLPIMIHKSTRFEYNSTPSDDIKIINEESLNELKANVNNFFVSISENNFELDSIRKNLVVYSLTNDLFIDKYTKKYTKKKVLG